MRVLMISSDRQILTLGSAVSGRMILYGELVDELNIVLLSDKTHGLKTSNLSSKVKVFPTNSASKFLRPLDALRIGKRLLSDLITCQDPFECGWVGMNLKAAHHTPLEIQLHTDPFSPHFTGFLNFVRKQMAKRVLRMADSVRLVRRGLLPQISQAKAYVLPIYVDRKRISGEPEFNLHDKFGFQNVILAVSRLSREKNISLAIGAVSRIPNAGLVVVGDGPERQSFKETDRIKFVGWQENLSSYYKTADVFIQTSEYEGYGLSLVEAGLSGLPVVTTPVGIATELSNVVIAETASEFSGKINELLNNKEASRMKGEALRQELLAEVYTKDAYLVKLKENWLKTAQVKTS